MARTYIVLPVIFLLFCGLAAAQQVPFEDIVGNLRNPDPKIRSAAVRLLREARYPEAAAPMAPLVTDPIDAIQLEAIAAELSFFLVEDVPATKYVALVVEVRNPAQAAAAFEGGALAVWPRPVPPELATALLQAIDDENPKVRTEAMYTFGAITRPPLDNVSAQQLIKALDHHDPAIRAAAARVIGRLRVTSAGDKLVHAINDSSQPVRYAAMRALGDLREERGLQALTDQLAFYGKGEGAWAALDGLARIAHPSGVPLFRRRLTDKDPMIRRAAAEGLARAGDTAAISMLEQEVGTDASAEVRAAMAFALQKLGKNFAARLVEFLDSSRLASQVDGYLLELGPPIAPTLLAHLNDPSASIRAHVARVLGVIGGAAAIAALQPLTQDRDRGVARFATEAIQRIKMNAE